jgi:hypothetical protein
MHVVKEKRKRKIWIAAASMVLVLAIIAGVCVGYVGDYYRADQNAIEAFAPMNAVSAELLADGTLVFKPENAVKGFIFYPGGKVEYTAYQPLMAACAQQGILCILVQMPFNLAVLDINAADGLQAQYPEIEKWYIGGHSLGGSMAASYLANHTDDFEGLILLGSYSTADLSGTGLDVLSVYGSEDQVMNRVKYDEGKSNLPSDLMEIIIAGGCHAYFGMYGPQEGDGAPTISNEEQILLTANHIFDVMK